MTTPILGLTELADATINQYAVSNEANRELEAALQDFTTVDLSSGDATLVAGTGSGEFNSAFLFRSSGNTVSRTITAPAQKRYFAVENGGSSSLNVEVGSTSVGVSSGTLVLFYADGTTNGLSSVAAGAATFATLSGSPDDNSNLKTDRFKVTAVTSSSGVVTLNRALGPYFTITLTENVTSWTISNLHGAGFGDTIAVQVTQDSTARTVALPSGATLKGGNTNAMPTGSGDVAVLFLTTFDNGTTWIATWAEDYA